MQFLTLPIFLLFILNLLEPSFSYFPEPRKDQGATLVGNFIYIYGGQTSATGISAINELILLPIYQSFDTTVPPYLSASGPQDTGPNVNGAVIFPGSQYGNEVFVDGGNINGGVQLAIYNGTSGVFKNATWPEGIGPAPRDSHSVSTNITAGKAYIFGGETSLSKGTALNDLWILDAIRLLWTSITSSIPLPRQAHTATLTTDGLMVVIGGSTNNAPGQTGPAVISLSKIDIFDTISQQWSNQNASNPPQARLSHTAVCTYTNQIIVFGGDDGSLSALGDLIVLDMDKLPLSWTIPDISGVGPSARYSHSAVMVGTTMFIMYGQIDNTTLDANIYALDTTTFTWTSQYSPNNLEYTWPFNNVSITPSPDPTYPSNSTSPTGPSTITIGVLTGVGGGVVVVIAVIILIIFISNRISRSNSRDIERRVAENQTIIHQTHTTTLNPVQNPVSNFRTDDERNPYPPVISPHGSSNWPFNPIQNISSSRLQSPGQLETVYELTTPSSPQRYQPSPLVPSSSYQRPSNVEPKNSIEASDVGNSDQNRKPDETS